MKHVIGVVSGKGGVGKWLVTSMLAVNMARRGYSSKEFSANGSLEDAEYESVEIPSAGSDDYDGYGDGDED